MSQTAQHNKLLIPRFIVNASKFKKVRKFHKSDCMLQEELVMVKTVQYFDQFL